MCRQEPPAAPSPGAAADHFVTLAERVPWAGSIGRIQRTRQPPYTDRADGTLDPVAHNRIKFFEIAIRFRQNASHIPTHKTAPYGWIDGYLRRICNRDCRPGALPLLGLGLPDLLNRLQRREILHQKPVSEDVPTTDLA